VIKSRVSEHERYAMRPVHTSGLRLVKREFLVLGWASPTNVPSERAAMAAFARRVSELSGFEVTVAALESYDAVAQRLHRREIDLAWLAPVPFIALHNTGAVAPLASTRAAPYRTAILVRARSGIRDLVKLRGWRAAWVDRHSASGFILPRLELSRRGVNPRTQLARERFFGTHAGVVGALVSGEADFAGTYAWTDATNKTVRGAWSGTELEHAVRVLATFGSIPSDVLVARADTAKDVRLAIVRALKTMTVTGDARTSTTRVFGSTGFCRPDPSSYERLRIDALDAHRRGLLDVDAADPLDVAKTLEIKMPAIELDDSDLLAV
jgi:ABC-type phosphate/phosphonate transport system substrate-binding protein